MSPEAGGAIKVDDALIAALYPQLRRLARGARLRYGAGETLRATVLVNEAFLKLRRSPGFVDEAHFLRTAARAMRQILVNHAAARTAAKRGGGAQASEFTDDMPGIYWESDDRLLALDAAMDRLAALSPRLADVVELRFFGGYGETEIATMLGCTDRTVRRDWVKAKALLLMDIGAGD
jgi:RNA polymerase sigma factor (TIGR02999 family)